MALPWRGIRSQASAALVSRPRKKTARAQQEAAAGVSHGRQLKGIKSRNAPGPTNVKIARGGEGTSLAQER